MFEVMASCPITAKQFEKYSWKPQTLAAKQGDRWTTIDDFDDLVTCARYYVQTNPRYQGKRIERATVVSVPNELTSPSMRRSG
jgi:hypothetical protein